MVCNFFYNRLINNIPGSSRLTSNL